MTRQTYFIGLTTFSFIPLLYVIIKIPNLIGRSFHSDMGSRAVKQIVDVSKVHTYQFPHVYVLKHHLTLFIFLCEVSLPNLLHCRVSSAVKLMYLGAYIFIYIKNIMFWYVGIRYRHCLVLIKNLGLVGCWSYSSSRTTSLLYLLYENIFF